MASRVAAAALLALCCTSATAAGPSDSQPHAQGDAGVDSVVAASPLSFLHDSAGKVTLKWPDDGVAFHRLVLSQSGSEVTALSKEGEQFIEIPRGTDWPVFAALKPGTADARLEASDSVTFDNVETIFDGIVSIALHAPTTYALADVSPELFPLAPYHAGDLLEVKGKAGEKGLTGMAAVARPDLLVDAFAIASGSDLLAGESFSTEYTLEWPGTYLFELSDADGMPVLITPVYVDAGLPVAPHRYFDLFEVPGPPPAPLDLEGLRKLALDLVNTTRIEAGFGPLELDDKLNGAAQMHSESMAENQFFAHVDPVSGLGPGDRLAIFGVNASYAENIAKEKSVEVCQEILFFSPFHRSAMLGPGWKTLGVGLALDDDAWLYMTQEFSVDL